MDVKSFYFKHYHQRIFMRWSNTLKIPFWKNDVRFATSQHLWWQIPRVNTIHLLVYAFFKDFKDTPATCPPAIILISPTGAWLSSISCSLSFPTFWCHLYESIFHTNLCSFPCRIKVFIWSFRCLHSFVRCLWSWWNLQYLFLSLTSAEA